MKRILLLLFAATIALLAEPVPLENISSQEFLEIIRKPLRNHAWGEFTGTLQYKGQKKNIKTPLHIRVTFTDKSMHAQITINKKLVYTLEQLHYEGKKVTATIERPDKEEPFSIFDLGVSPADLTFSFLYWDFLEELSRDSVKMQDCRRMKLAAPDSDDHVIVWFSAKYGFPMEAQWFHKEEKKPWRTLEIKGAKQYENGLWFVKEVKLQGDNWKTLITFDFASMNPIGE